MSIRGLKQLEALSEQARLLAQAEGLTLVRNARHGGYVGVSQRGQRYKAAKQRSMAERLA